MKTLFALALLSGLASAAQAQTDIKAGTVQLGGNVGYFRNSLESPTNNGSYYYSKATTTNSQFSVAPSVGFFVADNLAVGISGSYQMFHSKYNESVGVTSELKSKQYQIGAFVQYYKMVTEQFGFTGTLGGGYQYAENFYTGSPPTKGAYANLTPGLVFFPIPKLAIGASIGGLNYTYASYKAPDSFNSSETYHSSSFGANFGLSQLLFSGTYYFGR
ncbi:MAG: hypothetical protein ACRYF0_07275 [Janthinobacterium lividum]